MFDKEEVEYRATVMELMRKLNHVLIENNAQHDVMINAFIGMLAMASCDSGMPWKDYCRAVHRALTSMCNQMAEPGQTLQ
jgi:hypothetical protein